MEGVKKFAVKEPLKPFSMLCAVTGEGKVTCACVVGSVGCIYAVVTSLVSAWRVQIVSESLGRRTVHGQWGR